MNNKPLVSVVIIFLNAEKFLQEAIESVFAQTCDDWELLLVDDGSTDESTEIALHYAEQYPTKVRYLEHGGHRNRGAPASRNLGSCHAKGEYIAFLDADDVWLPHKLERQVALLRSQPEAAMVYGPVQIWCSWTGEAEDSQRDLITELGVQPDSLIRPPELVIRAVKNQPPVPLPSTFMVRREVVERVGGFEETFQGMYQLHEELAFSAKIFLNASVFVSGVCLTKHRQHPDNCGGFWARRGEYHHERPHAAQLFFLNWLEGYLAKNGIKDTRIWEALEQQIWPYDHPILYRALESAQFIRAKWAWVWHTCWILLMAAMRSALRRSTGSMRACPNPIQIRDWPGVGVTSLSWTSRRSTEVEVHVGAPSGPIFSRTGPSGNASTGNWVRDGMVFYLQDVTEGLPLSLANTLDIVRVRVSRIDSRVTNESEMIGKWNYQNIGEPFAYGDDTTYRKGVAFLDGHGAIEDWGCGTAYAKKFVKKSRYVGIDGSPSRFVDKVVDLRYYMSKADCIFMRHVLEHNHDWRNILANAVGSFRKRMVLIIFTPFSNKTRRIPTPKRVTSSLAPYISFRKEDLIEFFGPLKYKDESVETNTEYKREHIFYIER